MKLKKMICTAMMLFSSNVFLNAQDTKECDGFKMTSEGKKICTYLDDYDGKTRNVYADIRQDTIIYTIFRTNSDGSLDMMKKWHFFIAHIDFTTYSTGVFDWMNGNQKINKLAFQVVPGQIYFWEEIFCGSGKTPAVVNTKNTLEMSFTDETEAKVFFEKVKAIKATVKVPEVNNDKGSKTSGSGSLSVFNDSGSDVYLKQGSSATHFMKNETKKFSAIKAGDEIYWSDQSGKKGALALKVTEQMLKDGTIKLSTGTKK
jgi:hypothetical protein